MTQVTSQWMEEDDGHMYSCMLDSMLHACLHSTYICVHAHTEHTTLSGQCRRAGATDELVDVVLCATRVP